MKTRAFFFLLFLLLNSPLISGAQPMAEKDQPEIGKPIPDFQLKNIGNFKKKEMAAADFKGRFVIMDFWNKSCVSCVQSFPKLNQIHQKYKDKLDLILVGTDETGIQEMFGSFRERQKLEFAFAFSMAMYKSFVPGGAPHIIWINDQGIVQAVSSGGDLTSSNIEAFLQGKPFEFSDRSHSFLAKQEAAYNSMKPFLVKGNGSEEYESKFRYRSLIAEYIPGTPSRSWPDTDLWRTKYSTGIPDGKRRIFEACTGLREFYTVAFTGYMQWGYGEPIYSEFQGRIILEMSDTSLFEADMRNGVGLYWYSLIMPEQKATPAYVMESMQNDLKRYFGYNARIEKRKFPVLKIVATEKAGQLITKGGKREGKADHSMFKATNISLNEFFRFAFAYHGYWENNGKVPVLINETGITGNVDIDIKMDDSSWEDVKRALNELGFSLVKAEKEFKVLVISDK